MKFIIISLVLLSSAGAIKAQNMNDTARLKVSSFTTQFLISTDLESVYFNYIGAGTKYSNKYTAFSVTVFPSLRFYKDRPIGNSVKAKPFITPGLAVGLLVQHKKLLIGTPAFYSGSESRWHFTIGMGYVIGKN
jgi:hypothetical protein